MGELPLELSRDGELIIMSPVGGESGNQEANLIADVIFWNRQSKLGLVFSSSTVFDLPNGGKRSPDVAWISQARWDTLTSTKKKISPLFSPLLEKKKKKKKK